MTWKDALDEIQQRDGLLRAPAVVDEATDPSSPLHEYFEWDDDKAAAAHRVQQAHRLICRYEVVLVESNPTPTRAFVSLGSDAKAGGGYRPIGKVLSDADQRAELLQQAIRELQAIKKRYGDLQELAKVYAALDKVKVPRKRRARQA